MNGGSRRLYAWVAVAAFAVGACGSAVEPSVHVEDGGRTPSGTSSDRRVAGSFPAGEAVRIEVHLPLTGASPLGVGEGSAGLYWRWLEQQHNSDVAGEGRVKVALIDDGSASAAGEEPGCRASAGADVVGGLFATGAAERCRSAVAAQGGTAYVAADPTPGDARNGAQSTVADALAQQTELLAEYVAERYPGRRLGAVVVDEPAFDLAAEAWGETTASLDAADVVRPAADDVSWHADTGRQLHDAGVEVVFLVASPLDFVQFSRLAPQEASFQFVGVGTGFGIDPVAKAGCPDVDGAVVLSPFPALDRADDLEPAFRLAAEEFDVEVDDVAWMLWWLARAQHRFLSGDETVGDGSAGFSQLHLRVADCSVGGFRDAGTVEVAR